MPRHLNYGRRFVVAAAALLLLAALACSSAIPTPSPPPSPAPEPALCSGPIPHLDSTPAFAVNDQRDGYIWVLPDDTDGGVTFEQVLVSLGVAGEVGPERTRLAMPTWSHPIVSPDHTNSAIVLERRKGMRQPGSSFVMPVVDWIVVLSSAEQPVTGIFEVPSPIRQGLILPDWGATIGCLMVKVFDPDADRGRIYLVDEAANLQADVFVQLARGTVIDDAGAGWLIVDRTAWADEPDAEFVNIDDPENHFQLAADAPFPSAGRCGHGTRSYRCTGD